MGISKTVNAIAARLGEGITDKKERKENKWIFEVKEYKKTGYAPVIDFESWTVAVLNDIDELEIPNLKTMQKHLESDDVFGSAFFLFAQECAILGDK